MHHIQYVLHYKGLSHNKPINIGVILIKNINLECFRPIKLKAY
jgi:hypothetical protein